jgi:UDP-galactopyranose mutase
MERYYPVKDKNGHNRERYRLYKSLIPKNMEFIGRCGLYAYLDMHQAIASALAVSKRYLYNTVEV